LNAGFVALQDSICYLLAAMNKLSPGKGIKAFLSAKKPGFAQLTRAGCKLAPSNLSLQQAQEQQLHLLQTMHTARCVFSAAQQLQDTAVRPQAGSAGEQMQEVGLQPPRCCWEQQQHWNSSAVIPASAEDG
jgi:hypothetical protein